MDRKIFLLVLSLLFLSGVFANDIESRIGLLGDRQLEANYVGDEELSPEGKIFSSPSNLVLTLISSDGLNLTTSNLNCSGILSDIDGDNMNVSVRWYKNSVLNRSMDYNNSYSNGTLFSSILTSGNTSKGEIWKCSARLFDGYFYSNWANSSELVILNSLPVVTLVSLPNWNATTNRTPLFNWTGYDADGDSLTYDFKIEEAYFAGGGTSCDDYRMISDLGTNRYTPTSDLLCLYDNGYYYNWSVLANDGVGDGAWASVWHFNLTAEVSISLSSDEVAFGLLIPGAVEDTSDGSPGSFVIDNDGNVITNISLNSTALWRKQPADSIYYRFKANNVSGEEGSFNWLFSVVSWFDMPINGNVVGVAELNYPEAEDSAKVDIRLEVPSSEGPGVKNASIIFTGSLAE